MSKKASSKPAIWISPHPDGWKVQREGSKKPSHITNTQSDAIDIGKAQAQKSRTELVVQRPNGQIRSKDSYGSDPNPPTDKEH